MIRRSLCLTCALLGSLVALVAAPAAGTWKDLPVDPAASPETVALYQTLRRVAQDQLLIGHTDTNIMGINRDGTGWSYDENRSDVKDIVGDYPAVYGFDIVNLEFRDPDSVDDLRFIVPRIRDAFSRGGIATVSWHAYNPITAEDFYKGSPVRELLPGAPHHDKLRRMLDRLADLIGNLSDGKGKSIPILFRPWHEANGSQFWWGRDRCSDLEYIRLFRFTLEYLRDVRKVHNFLYVYSPVDWYGSMTDYMQRYPGDETIDVLGLDTYGSASGWYRDRLRYYTGEMVRHAEKTGKIAAVTEMGYKNSEQEAGFGYCQNPAFLSRFLLETFRDDPVARRISYLVFWRNEAYNPGTYYLPYPGSAHEADLQRFFQAPFTWFESDLPDMYRSPPIQPVFSRLRGPQNRAIADPHE